MTHIAQSPTNAATWRLPNPPSVREAVTDRIRRAILDQEILPGTRLRQVQVADALGVSRMPVRDAIQGLIAEGLLYSLPTGGVMVPPFEISEVLDALRLRGPLEAEAVDAAAERMPSTVGRPLLNRYPTGVDFHRTLGALAQNRFLVSALTPIWAQMERAAVVLAPLTACHPDSPEHEAIAQSLEGGHRTAAKEVLEGHLHAVRDEVTLHAARSSNA